MLFVLFINLFVRSNGEYEKQCFYIWGSASFLAIKLNSESVFIPQKLKLKTKIITIDNYGRNSEYESTMFLQKLHHTDCTEGLLIPNFFTYRTSGINIKVEVFLQDRIIEYFELFVFQSFQEQNLPDNQGFNNILKITFDFLTNETKFRSYVSDENIWNYGVRIITNLKKICMRIMNIEGYTIFHTDYIHGQSEELMLKELYTLRVTSYEDSEIMEKVATVEYITEIFECGVITKYPPLKIFVDASIKSIQIEAIPLHGGSSFSMKLLKEKCEFISVISSMYNPNLFYFEIQEESIDAAWAKWKYGLLLFKQEKFTNKNCNGRDDYMIIDSIKYMGKSFVINSLIRDQDYYPRVSRYRRATDQELKICLPSEF